MLAAEYRGEKGAEEVFLALLDCFCQNTGRGQSTRFSVLRSCSRKFPSVCRLSVNTFVVYCMFILKLLQFCQKGVILTTGTRQQDYVQISTSEYYITEI